MKLWCEGSNCFLLTVREHGFEVFVGSHRHRGAGGEEQHARPCASEQRPYPLRAVDAEQRIRQALVRLLLRGGPFR